MSSSSSSRPSCQIDQDILNGKSVKDMNDIALSFFASACGKNRGAFVLDPPDGNTYGCLVLPEDIAELADIVTPSNENNLTLADANSIKDNYLDGNITGSETVSVLDFFVERVYESTPLKESNLYACDVNGLAKLSCGGGEDQGKKRSPRSDGQPIRSVTLAGLLIPDAPWATTTKGTSKQGLYTTKDFQEMKAMGLNTVQISVPTSVFTPNDTIGKRIKEVLVDVLDDLQTTGGLQAILLLVATGDELDSVVAAAKFAAKEDVVLALTLPKKMTIDTNTVIDSVRAKVGPDLILFVPLQGDGDLAAGKTQSNLLMVDDPNVYGSLDWSHISTIADVASSSSQEDRSKMFYHEAVACTMRSPIEHSACFRGLPIFWSSGFDLSVDDCAQKGSNNSFKDYGQCDRFEETIESGWWQRHRKSFAARQLFAAERGIGWSFAAWKLYDSNGSDSEEDKTNSTTTGVMDEPAKLLSLRDVVKAGLFPNLSTSTTTSSSAFPAQMACLNPPENDFALGDDTLAPTMGPPPDCGNGWWNSTTSQCDYWVPPPEPTMSPTVPCPECEKCPTTAMAGTTGTATQPSTMALVMAGFGGAAAVLIFGFIYKLVVEKKRRNEYSSIPH